MNLMKSELWLGVTLWVATMSQSCSKIDGQFPFPDAPDMGGIMPGGGMGEDDGEVPTIDQALFDYAGERADDAGNDVVGSDKDIYWEANAFTTKVLVRYEGDKATVEYVNADIESHVEGAHVVIDMRNHAATDVEIELSGKSDDGSLKIYGEKKFKLMLNGVELTSRRGPAINSQCKKRIFVCLADGTTNTLTDVAEYADDAWYPDGSSADKEDRKGCFFSEGNLIFSGTGTLIVAGKQKHGIASDGYMLTRPGVTIAVKEAAKNAIHIKGDKDDEVGIRIAGGLIYVASAGSKAIKTDLHAEVMGGKLVLNTVGDAFYEQEENDVTSAAGIKTDGDIRISGGEVYVKSTGLGGKGLNADGSISITDGKVYVLTTGGKYVYNAARNLDASPKGVKADGNITIDGGTIVINVIGVSDGSEGLESKAALAINGGDVCVYAYDDAINASSSITVNGGRVWVYSVSNDGIDSNGTMTFNGGVTVSAGSSAPEEAFDCDRSEQFKITGGTLVGIGGSAVSPSSASTQHTVIYNGLQLAKDGTVAILDASGKAIMAYTIPRTLANGMTLFYSSPLITAGATYSVSTGGTIATGSATQGWGGWHSGATWTGGSEAGTFTSSSIVTVVGTTNGPGGGGFPNGPGGPGGGW